MIWIYIIIAVILLAAELIYFRIADRCNIIDKPNERSSHSTIVLRGGESAAIGAVYQARLIHLTVYLHRHKITRMTTHAVIDSRALFLKCCQFPCHNSFNS